MSAKIISKSLAILSLALGVTSGKVWAEPIHATGDFHVHKPSYFLYFDYGNKVVNLTPQQGLGSRGDHYNSVSDTLVYGDYSGGFLVTKFRFVDAGYGQKIIWFHNNVTGLKPAEWSVVGLVPFVGSEVASVKFVADLKAAKAVKASAPPLKAEELKAWTAGDYSYNNTFGGVIFFAQIGVGGSYGPGVGPVYVARGNWDVYVEKVGADHAFVRLTNSKLKDLSLQAGNILVGVSAETFKKSADSMSYMINISTAEGAKAYNDLVRGNVAAIQMLSTNPNSSRIVQKWDHYSGKVAGRMTNFYLGIPIIAYWTWTAGKIYELYDTQFFYSNSKSTVNYGIYLKERRTHLFGNHTQRSQVFYGATIDVKSMDNQPLGKSHFAQYSWIADTSMSSQENLQKVIADLIQKTGLSELAVNVPPAEDLDYVKVEFRATFDEASTLRLIQNSKQTARALTSELAVSKVLKYFEMPSDSLGLCADDADFEACQSRLIKETRAGVREMYQALERLNASLSVDDTQAFVKAYAELGRAVLKNSFVFKTCLELAGEGVTMDYAILGTHNSAYRVQFVTTNTPGVFRKTPGQIE